MSKPPRIVVPGLNRGAGVPPGYVLGRLPGTGKGPAQLLDLTALRRVGLATASGATQSTSQAVSIAHSEIVSLSTSVSSSLSSVTSINVGQSTSLSQVSSSLSGAISSTSSLSTAVSTVISGSISVVNSRIDSLSAAGGGGATTFLALTDTPATYAGQAAKVVRVNAGETALEFAAGSVDPGQSTSLSQISSSLSGAISSTTSLSTAVSTVISGSISTTLSTAASATASLSTAIGSGGTGVTRLTASTTPTGTPANNNETDLLSYSIAGGTLASDGQAIRVTAAGTYAATTRNRTLRFYFGATVLFATGTATSANVRWRIEAEIIRIDATNQRISGTLAFGAEGADVAAYTVNLDDAAETLSGAVVVKITGQVAGAAAANDIIGNFFLVEFLS